MILGGNLFWGNHLRYFGDKISLNGRPSPISLILRQNNAKHYRHYFDCRFVQSTNLMTKSNKNPLKSFCYFWLLPKVESLLPLDSNPPRESQQC